MFPKPLLDSQIRSPFSLMAIKFPVLLDFAFLWSKLDNLLLLINQIRDVSHILNDQTHGDISICSDLRNIREMYVQFPSNIYYFCLSCNSPS